MARYKAKYNSYGFRNRYWEKGTIVSDVHPVEEKDCPELKHFRLINESNENVKTEDIQETLALLTYRNAYYEKYKKDIPTDKYNNISWLKKEVETPDELITLREQYTIKFKEEVPVNVKNNIEWLKKKVEEV